MSKIVCDCNLCRIEKVLFSLDIDSSIKMFEQPTDFTRVGTTGDRLKKFLVGKMYLEFGDLECKKENRKI